MLTQAFQKGQGTFTVRDTTSAAHTISQDTAEELHTEDQALVKPGDKPLQGGTPQDDPALTRNVFALVKKAAAAGLSVTVFAGVGALYIGGKIVQLPLTVAKLLLRLGIGGLRLILLPAKALLYVGGKVLQIPLTLAKKVYTSLTPKKTAPQGR